VKVLRVNSIAINCMLLIPIVADRYNGKQDRRATRKRDKIFSSKERQHTIYCGSTEQPDRVYVHGEEGEILLKLLRCTTRNIHTSH